MYQKYTGSRAKLEINIIDAILKQTPTKICDAASLAVKFNCSANYISIVLAALVEAEIVVKIPILGTGKKPKFSYRITD